MPSELSDFKPAESWLATARRYYCASAVLLMNTAVFILLLNVALWCFFLVFDSARASDPATPRWVDPVTAKYGEELLDEARQVFFPAFSKDEFRRLQAETWSRPYVYSPFVQFRESLHQGRYVNVSSEGFRLTADQGPWPPASDALSVFMFGGSTTFGYGVPDRDTVASYLQDDLERRLGRAVHVYNFGQGDYYSTQERILFEQLVAAGRRPDVAVFLDGLNDFAFLTDEPVLTTRLRNLVAGAAPEGLSAGSDQFVARMPDWIPAVRLASALRRRLDGWLWAATADGNGTASKEVPMVPSRRDPVVSRSVIDRYFANKRLIEAAASGAGIRTFFVVQPVPMFRYDDSFHLFREPTYDDFGYVRYGYEDLERYIATNDAGHNLVSCADVQRIMKEPLYVDLVHYAPKLSRVVAACIGDFVVRVGVA